MVKAYLRYEPAATFGIITSGAQPCYDASGKLLITAALESVVVWNIKQASQVAVLTPSNSSEASSSTASSKAQPEVTCITRAPGSSALIAVGYGDGSVRLWDLISKDCLVTLQGHKSGVSCLRFSADGALLASGSKDTDLVVWDVAGEAGLFRLRGHKDQITALAFLNPPGTLPATPGPSLEPGSSSSGSRALGAGLTASCLVSSSKDGLIKVWDLGAQTCCQTVTGFKAEVWALDVDPSQRRLVAGSTDHELRVYAVNLADITSRGGQGQEATEAGTEAGQARLAPQVLRPMGAVKRAAGGGERVAALAFDASGSYLAVQSAGKTLEVFRVRGAEEVAKKLKRRLKRQREKRARKQQKAAAGGGGQLGAPGGAQEDSSEDEGGPSGEGAEGEVVAASDEMESFQILSFKSKVRSCCFAPPAAPALRRPKEGPGVACQLAVCLSNNSVEVLDVKAQAAAGYASVTKLEMAGHRSDVRAVTLSSDDQLLATASNAAVKVWNPRTGSCLATLESGYGLSLLFAPGNRHLVLGTKEGQLEVFDLGAAQRVAVEAAHEGAVWSLAALPDGSGFVSGSADKTVKFWQWSVTVSSSGARSLRLLHTRTLRMAEDVTCVRLSPDGRLLAVALLDTTVKVFYSDTLKFFLSLYGHKLPVMSMDISSDSTLLATGSADKNIKVWGLDFGDCHRSLFAHAEAVMAVHWVPGTHYAFTAGKDKMVKYWDLDRFELLLELPGHHGEVWCCAVSSRGDFLVTGSHDRSLRRWQRSAESFFVEEEKEKRLESLFEADLEQQPQPGGEGQPGGGEAEQGGVAPAGRKTLEAVSAADALVDALEMARHEAERQAEFAAQQQQQGQGQGQRAGAVPQGLPPNPLLLGLSPSAYLLRALSSVKAGDLESALLMLPFTDALRLMTYLPQWLQQGAGQAVELVARVAVLLLRLHHTQLRSTPSARPSLARIHAALHAAVQGLKDTLGFNVAALQHLQRAMKERSGMTEAADAASGRLVKRPAGKKQARGMQEQGKGVKKQKSR